MSASTDTIGDFLTSIRNGSQANKAVITVQWSRLREGVAKILVDAGYVAAARKAEREGLPVLELSLKYVAGVPAITSIERVSTPVVASTPVTPLSRKSSAAWASPSSPPPVAS
jgi:ribosomal protein S8